MMYMYMCMHFIYCTVCCTVQDQGCLPGLVVFLDNANSEVVYTALEVNTVHCLFITVLTLVYSCTCTL